MTTNLNHCCPDPSSHQDCQAVEKKESGDGGDENEPEPEEDVDFLVDYVKGQHTKTIMPLNCSRRTVFVEGAFRNLGEDNCHGVGPVLRIHLRISKNRETIRGELIAKESENYSTVNKELILSSRTHLSMRNICPITLTKLRTSHVMNFKK